MKQITKQIICIGGGGFGRKPKQRIIEKYILLQSNAETPNILFIPTASAEDKSYIVSFYTCFNGLNCIPTHINLFERTPRLEGVVNKADIIYVGGGNTKSMLAVWKEWKLDKLLLKAYNRGAILCGVSAGAICWFKQGITDSWASNLNVMGCLDFVSGCCCPHYDGEGDRRPSVHDMIKNDKIESCLAVEDGAALHYRNGKLLTSVSFYKDKKTYIVKNSPSGIIEEEVRSIQL